MGYQNNRSFGNLNKGFRNNHGETINRESFKNNRKESFGGAKWNDVQGPPEYVIPLGYYCYSCQSDIICKVEMKDIPYFNAPIYLKSKEVVGKIDEIFGNIKDYYVSIRLNENFPTASLQENVELFVDPAKILPLSRFLNPGPPAKRGLGGGRGGGRGRGSFRGRGGGRGGGGRGGGSFQGRGGFGGRRGGFGARRGGFRGREGSGGGRW